MSNVLIGVVGVMLFIGLALAGASFFGAEFFRSKNVTTGAVAVQRAGQLAAAIHAYQARTGKRFPNADMPTQQALVSAGYMKAVVAKPVGSTGENFRVLGSDFQSITVGRVGVVAADLGLEGEVCRAIARAAGNTSFDPAAPGAGFPAPAALRQFDCLRVDAGAAATSGLAFDFAGSYVMYVRV